MSAKSSAKADLSFLERQAMIAWLAVPGIGRKTFRKVEQNLLEMRIALSDLWERSGDWKKAGLGAKQSEYLANFQKKYDCQSYARFLDEKEIRVVTIYDNNYPKLLKEIDDPPLVLYIKGKDIEQEKTAISVVGTRKVTPYGEKATQKIVGELVGQGVIIVSGFMYGVDYLAHQTAVECAGQTVGVVGFGFDYIYPKSFAGKFEYLLKRGMTFVSEYPPFVQAKKGCFPERNRIVAGLSAGTIVIEAAARSGTSITANLAAEYGREVFAVPGSIFSPYSEGTRALINNGACLVGSGYEVLEELGGGLIRDKGWINSEANYYGEKEKVKAKDRAKAVGGSKTVKTKDQEIYELFKDDKLSVDEISLRTGKSVAEITAMISLVELGEIA